MRKKILTYVDKLFNFINKCDKMSQFKTSLEISKIFLKKSEKSVNQKSKKK